MNETTTKSVISTSNIAAAEMLFGIEYTEAERTLMLDNLLVQARLAEARRALALPPDLGPATRFDPRLPGFVMPEPGPFMCEPHAAPLPEQDADIAFAPVTNLAFWIRARTLSAERLTRIYLDRIARIAPALNCFVTVTAESALARAAELDAMLARGEYLGLLHGVPYGLKDIIDTKGVETSWGAEPYRGRIPTEDAHVTALLHQAGAVLLGKTSVGALAYGDIWHGGRTRNPWNTEEGSSGSSAGSAAATAAGLVGFAIGTETLGSIVSPSARCGTTGLRPTYGRVSRSGAMALCWSLDKIGPICRAVDDTALVLQAINAPDPSDPFQIPAPFGYDSSLPVTGLRLGYFPADLDHKDAHPLDRAALEQAQALGLVAVPLQRPDLPYDSLRTILNAEAASAFEALTLENRDDELTRQDADAWPNSFRKARFLSAVDHIQADRLRRLVMQEMDRLFGEVDAIIGPSLAGPMLSITNFTGHPCLCLRSGLRRSRTRPALTLSMGTAPVAEGPEFEIAHSIALTGRLYGESTILAIGRALEAAFGVAHRRPPLG